MPPDLGLALPGQPARQRWAEANAKAPSTQPVTEQLDSGTPARLRGEWAGARGTNERKRGQRDKEEEKGGSVRAESRKGCRREGKEKAGESVGERPSRGREAKTDKMRVCARAWSGGRRERPGRAGERLGEGRRASRARKPGAARWGRRRGSGCEARGAGGALRRLHPCPERSRRGRSTEASPEQSHARPQQQPQVMRPPPPCAALRARRAPDPRFELPPRRSLVVPDLGQVLGRRASVSFSVSLGGSSPRQGGAWQGRTAALGRGVWGLPPLPAQGLVWRVHFRRSNACSAPGSGRWYFLRAVCLWESGATF